MAKRKQQDGSGFTMSALIRQVLMDGKEHSLSEIADHVQEYMCKTIPKSQFEKMLQRILEQDKDLEQKKKDYKLKSGESTMDLVSELIASSNAPLAKKDIVKMVAKKQNLPPQTVDIDIENDDRFNKINYKNKDYYYLANRKIINTLVHQILKDKERPLSFSEIYKIIESEHDLKKSEVIFLPREDNKIKRQPGNRFALRTAKPKKKPPKPIHNVTRPELEKVIEHLKATGEQLSASNISEKVLNRKLEQTNLRIKLSRDSRLKRAKELFYYDQEPTVVEIPQKIKDRVSSQYFKVKACLVGSSDVFTVEELLDRIYKINLSNMEYDFYRELLVEYLMQDEGVVKTLTGWIHAEADDRTTWNPPRSAMAAEMPDPPCELDVNKLTNAEQQFLDRGRIDIEMRENQVVHTVTLAERWRGFILLTDEELLIFPEFPQYYEAVFTDQNQGNEFPVYLNRKKSAMLDLLPLFEAEYKDCIGLITIVKREENEYRFNFVADPMLSISEMTERQEELTKWSQESWKLPELLAKILKRHKKSLSIEKLWAEASAVKQFSKTDFIAVLQDYKCFVQDKKLDGVYALNEKAGWQRISISLITPEMEKIERIEPAKEVVEEAVKPKEEKVSPVKEPEVLEKPETVATPVAVQDFLERKSKAVPKKKIRRHRDEEEIPDHIKRLKTFGRRLPRLETVKSMVVKPSEDEHGARIGAVSVGRIEHTDRRIRDRKPKSDDSQILLSPPPESQSGMPWDTANFVNPDRGAGHAELYQALEVLKTFIQRPPQVRKTDGSV
ncbi:hypothetical protein JW979_13405, partial [bacterium]|nr:hypothetical protein [candidate division CSSED10-310 bacterium]